MQRQLYKIISRYICIVIYQPFEYIYILFMLCLGIWHPSAAVNCVCACVFVTYRVRVITLHTSILTVANPLTMTKIHTNTDKR